MNGEVPAPRTLRVIVGEHMAREVWKSRGSDIYRKAPDSMCAMSR